MSCNAGSGEVTDPGSRPKSWTLMFTTALWFFLLFVSRVSADILVRSKSSRPSHSSPSGQVSDVYSSQSQCDTSVDPVRSRRPERNPSDPSRSVQEQQGRNAVHNHPRATYPVQRERFSIQQLVPILPSKRTRRC